MRTLAITLDRQQSAIDGHSRQPSVDDAEYSLGCGRLCGTRVGHLCEVFPKDGDTPLYLETLVRLGRPTDGELRLLQLQRAEPRNNGIE